jgi:hypothetical protein
MPIIECVGGSLDGATYEVHVMPKLGDAAIFPMGQDYSATEQYVFESDGKYHFYGLAPPLVHGLPEDRLIRLRTDVQKVLDQMLPLVSELSRLFEDVGGYDFPLRTGEWVLHPDYRMFQQLADATNHLRRESLSAGIDLPNPRQGGLRKV